MRISLKDGAANERAFRVSPFYNIPYPDEWPNVANRKSAMVSIRIPLNSFKIVCVEMVKLNLSDITELSLNFSKNLQQ